jgi:hypothetical protein
LPNNDTAIHSLDEGDAPYDELVSWYAEEDTNVDDDDIMFQSLNIAEQAVPQKISDFHFLLATVHERIKLCRVC